MSLPPLRVPFSTSYPYYDSSSIVKNNNVPLSLSLSLSLSPRHSPGNDKNDDHEDHGTYNVDDDDNDDDDDQGRHDLKKMDPYPPGKKKARRVTVSQSEMVPTEERHDNGMAVPFKTVAVDCGGGGGGGGGGTTTTTFVSPTVVASTAASETSASTPTEYTATAAAAVASVALPSKTVAGTKTKQTAGSASTVASKKPSHQTTKIWTHFHQMITNSQEPLVAWSDDGKSMIIADWKEFSKRKLHKHMFGYSQAITFNRAFERCHFRREKSKAGKTTMVRFTHPNFVRDDPGLVSGILSSRGNAVEKKYDSHFKPCHCKGCRLRGEDGNNRVWYADLLCEACQQVFVGETDKELAAEAQVLLDDHLAKILQRNDYKQTYYDKVALERKRKRKRSLDD